MNYALQRSRSAWVVGCSVRLSVRNITTTNDPKVFKVGIGMTVGYPRNDMVLMLKGHRLGLSPVSTTRVDGPSSGNRALELRQQQYNVGSDSTSAF